MSLPDFFFVPAGTGPTERRERLAGMGGGGEKVSPACQARLASFQPGSVARDESLRSILTHDMGQALFGSSPESKHLDGFFPSGLKSIWLGRGSLRTGLFAAKQTFFAPAKFGQKRSRRKRLIWKSPSCLFRIFFAAAQVSRSKVLFPLLTVANKAREKETE